jgi:hypothetical protein
LRQIRDLAPDYHVLIVSLGDKDMGRVAEYLEKAAEFDELAKSTNDPALSKRCADLALSYRLLASVLQRLIETGEIEWDGP